MFIQNYKEPESSFLSVEKDTAIILDKIIDNENLNRLLFYNTPDALKRPKLTNEEKLSVQKECIHLVPKLYIDSEVLNYINISFRNFLPSENPQFKNNVVAFDIICHFDQWELDDLKLRPYRIAAEIDSTLRNVKLTGIGHLEFLGADILTLNDEFCGLSLLYQTVHGGEDHKHPLNPLDAENIKKNFDDVINNIDEDEWIID